MVELRKIARGKRHEEVEMGRTRRGKEKTVHLAADRSSATVWVYLVDSMCYDPVDLLKGDQLLASIVHFLSNRIVLSFRLPNRGINRSGCTGDT